MKQKFFRYDFVRVADEMPRHMGHFPKSFDAIISGSYSDFYGGADVKNYSIFRLDGGKITNSIAWYEEGELSLCANQDMDRAKQLIDDYQFRNFAGRHDPT